MKFLCLPCDEVMGFAERQVPGDGTMAAVFVCPGCGREMAMLTNPMETQLVSSLGVKVGGREVPAQPMEGVRTGLSRPREDAFREAPEPDSPGAGPGPVRWSPDAVERLERVPRFVRGMVKKIYVEYARERGIGLLTPDVMDVARAELGLEGM